MFGARDYTLKPRLEERQSGDEFVLGLAVHVTTLFRPSRTEFATEELIFDVRVSE